MARPAPVRGEVWLVDLGIAAKVRPCVVLSVDPALQDRALVTFVAHTTKVRGSRFEVSVSAKFLKPGAFDAQNLITMPYVKLIRKLGVLSSDQFALVEEAVMRWLDL